ncbi:light induced alcohol dehydrogenase Bli-4 [Fusarium agapanthi]|uniref:Light induced alcohol dehydrogenase Bli-4 n=1 Tax=Fusarium agapanthi TaxID=1803897 RepID=A0A9P5BG10_9HYPO|nr:light induced alcohol dehydrogenase Bli-4 [Fusarium agapanthi]
MGNTYSLFFPPSPQFTKENLTAQNGRVFIVTGGYSGVGFELSQSGISYQQLKKQHRDASGSLSFLKIALDDLDSIKAAAEDFKSRESRLDVLFNNAGVSNPPAGSVSAQGYELSMATNAIGPWYLTQLLVPILKETAKSQPPASVRVIWTASIVADLSVPKGGVKMEEVINPSKDQQVNYTNSKTGNWYLVSVLADQVGSHGILSVCHNPGNLHSNLLRHMPSIVGYIVSPLLYHAKFDAYTNLRAGLSPDLQIEDGERFILPLGRFYPSPRVDLLENIEPKEQGGTGTAFEFAEYCDKIIANHQ